MQARASGIVVAGLREWTPVSTPETLKFAAFPRCT
jgi:hypothetical protein